ncbi:MAG: alpha/beta hydrolase [Lachnospiraceae bacterium]|jgi:alpha-beta hydrolase superfamily lysophospholipase|nr:alpha/beta hydrolase [Lachnospiraceae bacterium]
MSYKKTVGTYPSSNKVNEIKYYVYEPEGKVCAMMQISHGMCEYIERYEPHISYFTSRGILVFGNDHLGHKGSVKSDDDLGYMGARDGWMAMVEDVHTLSRKMRQAHPELPLILFGHSMGSFIARAVIGKFGREYDGAIISGTGGTNKMLGLGFSMVWLSRRLRGDRARSAFLKKLSFGSYNKRYENVRTPEDWLTRDSTVVDAYREDKYCMFSFTTAGYADLLSVLDHVSQERWYDSVPRELPLLLVSGEMDPVGDFGKGVKEVDRRLRMRPHVEYTCKLYPDMRHEVLNEIGKETIYEEIVNFVYRRCE